MDSERIIRDFDLTVEFWHSTLYYVDPQQIPVVHLREMLESLCSNNVDLWHVFLILKNIENHALVEESFFSH